MSTHEVKVIRIDKPEKHPNADALELVKVWGYTAAVRLGDFHEGDLAVYVEPDYVVPGPEHPAGHLFAFLGDKRRIKARRLRGVWSQGLLVHAPEGFAEGDDVMESLGITRYEGPAEALSTATSDAEIPPDSLAHLPKYDVEPWRKYRHLLVPGEEVVITEKIHGANARYAWRDGRMWVGSRTRWVREDERSIWWMALRATPQIKAWCQRYPERVLFGEVYGQVQDLRYGTQKGEVRFAAFDGRESDGTWVAPQELARESLPVVPTVFSGAYDPNAMEDLSRGDSRIAKHLMEGIVIKPAVERVDPHIGRVALKLVSDKYLERSK